MATKGSTSKSRIKLLSTLFDVDANASYAQIKKSYNRIIKKIHPDANGNGTGKQMLHLKAAFEEFVSIPIKVSVTISWADLIYGCDIQAGDELLQIPPLTSPSALFKIGKSRTSRPYQIKFDPVLPSEFKPVSNSSDITREITVDRSELTKSDRIVFLSLTSEEIVVSLPSETTANVITFTFDNEGLIAGNSPHRGKLHLVVKIR